MGQTVLSRYTSDVSEDQVLYSLAPYFPSAHHNIRSLCVHLYRDIDHDWDGWDEDGGLDLQYYHSKAFGAILDVYFSYKSEPAELKRFVKERQALSKEIMEVRFFSTLRIRTTYRTDRAECKGGGSMADETGTGKGRFS